MIGPLKIDCGSQSKSGRYDRIPTHIGVIPPLASESSGGSAVSQLPSRSSRERFLAPGLPIAGSGLTSSPSRSSTLLGCPCGPAALQSRRHPKATPRDRRACAVKAGITARRSSFTPAPPQLSLPCIALTHSWPAPGPRLAAGSRGRKAPRRPTTPIKSISLRVESMSERRFARPEAPDPVGFRLQNPGSALCPSRASRATRPGGMNDMPPHGSPVPDALATSASTSPRGVRAPHSCLGRGQTSARRSSSVGLRSLGRWDEALHETDQSPDFPSRLLHAVALLLPTWEHPRVPEIPEPSLEAGSLAVT